MEDQVRELLDKEGSYKQQRILATLESFKTWLDWLGLLKDLLVFFMDIVDLYVRVRRQFGHR